MDEVTVQLWLDPGVAVSSCPYELKAKIESIKAEVERRGLAFRHEYDYRTRQHVYLVTGPRAACTELQGSMGAAPQLTE